MSYPDLQESVTARAALLSRIKARMVPVSLEGGGVDLSTNSGTVWEEIALFVKEEPRKAAIILKDCILHLVDEAEKAEGTSQ